MILTKKEIKTRNGTFKVGPVILNEAAIWEDESIKPICDHLDYMIKFLPNGSKGVHLGKKHFKSLEQAETYIWLLDVNGFSLMDL